MTTQPPTVPWHELLPVFLHPYRAYLDLHRRHGPTFVATQVGGPSLVLCADEVLARRLLSEHADALTRPPNVIRDIFEVIVGDNIVASAGTTWQHKRQRGTRLLSAATLEADELDGLDAALIELREDLRRAIGHGATLDLLPFIERFALTAALRMICGVELDAGSPKFHELLAALREIMDATQRIADVRKQVFLYPLLPPARRVVDRVRVRRLELAVARVAAFVPEPEVRELFMAGYENPSTTLSWALALLSARPHVQGRVRAEALGLGLDCEQRGWFEHTRYAEATVRETARLRPAIAYLAREAQVEIVLDELRLAPGSSFVVVPYCLHHDPQRWPAPACFEPARFLTDQQPRLWSFGVGPRACVGTRYAMRILAAALAVIAAEFVWQPVRGREPAPPSGRFPWSEKIHCWVRAWPSPAANRHA